MFVTNHVLSGVLIGQSMPGRPLTAFIVGVGSHLALDACPHWGCDLEVSSGEEQFLRVARRDGLLGLTVMAAAVMLVDRRTRVSTIAAMAGAVLLDLDKPFVHFFGVNPFPRSVDRLHKRVQNESPDRMVNELAYGGGFATIGAIWTARARGRVEK